MKKCFFICSLLMASVNVCHAQKISNYYVTDSTNWEISADNFDNHKMSKATDKIENILVIINDKIYSINSPEFLLLRKKDIKEETIIKSADKNFPVESAIIIKTLDYRF